MSIARDVVPLLILLAGVTTVVAVTGGLTTWWGWKGPVVVGSLGILFLLFFFRDPERAIPEVSGAIVAPGDGKIVDIRSVYEPDFFKKEILRISIFLSIFDVHITRIPMSGTVSYFQYNPGAFFPAFQEKASTENEQTVIGITNGAGKVLFKQIAGLIARRIVCTVKKEDEVVRGARCGIIKFGSRIDICVESAVKLHVRKGQRVKGGETIIGEFTHEE